MQKFWILKRLLWIIPTLLIISLVGFWFESLWPTHPVQRKVDLAIYQGGSNIDPAQLYLRFENELGYDRPSFYLGIPSESSASFFPKIEFNGLNNRYHTWVFGSKSNPGLIQGNLGFSYLDGRPVSDLIQEKWRKSALLSGSAILLSFLLTFLLAKPLFFAEGIFKKLGNGLLYLTYASPVFILGLGFLYAFANKSVLYWFPSGGWGEIGDDSWLSTLPYFVLPCLSLSLGSLAFLSHIHQAKLKEEWAKPYVSTALAKGLSKSQVFRNQVLKNSLFPLITAFGQSIPALVGGSVIIESLFSIPGLGALAFQSVQNGDFPVINALFLMTAFLTILGFLVSDLLYQWFDPRLKFEENA